MKTYLNFDEIIGKKKDLKLEQLGKVSSASVFKGTGKHWIEWVDLLDEAGAKAWTHPEIVSYLKKKHKLTPWWQQGVTSGYEIAIGRREAGQDLKGKYMVTTTKSLPCSVDQVWKFLVSDKGQKTWLKPFSKILIKPLSQFETADGFFGEIRTLKKNRRLRLTWQDPNWIQKTVLEIMLVPRPSKKSILVFNHTGISDTKTQALLRTRWKSVVDQVFEYCRE